MPELPRIFISATTHDLRDYREAVANALRELGAAPLAFESFPAAGESVASVLKQELNKSDAVVLLIGHRYGTTDPLSGKSYTELEYDLARSMQKPVLAFAASEEAPWPPSEIDRDYSRISRFRERLLSESLVGRFSSPSDLASQVVTAVSRLLRPPPPQTSNKTDPKTNLKQIRIVRLLLSSPGDVANEREAFSRAVFRFNQQAVEDYGIFIKLVRWEDMAPQIGPGTQNVISNQIGEYDLFSGIMWNRFGTPTEIASSGTEEEFEAAIASWNKNRRPWISFYFCDRPANFTTEEQLQQKQKVLKFRSRLQSLGVLRFYREPADFEELVYRDLLRITSLPEFRKLIERDGD